MHAASLLAGDRRSLATIMVWLDEMNAREQATRMTMENPALLLEDRAIAPVAPVQFQKGVFDRLRELIFGSARRSPASSSTLRRSR